MTAAAEEKFELEKPEVEDENDGLQIDDKLTVDDVADKLKGQPQHTVIGDAPPVQPPLHLVLKKPAASNEQTPRNKRSRKPNRRALNNHPDVVKPDPENPSAAELHPALLEEEEDFQKCGACGRGSDAELTYGPGDLLYGPDEDDHFWILCNACQAWYHGRCVNVQEYESVIVDKYHCPQCQASGSGESTMHEYRNDHRHEFWDVNGEYKPAQVGTKRWIQKFLQTEATRYPSVFEHDVIDICETGDSLKDVLYAHKTWRRPILIKRRTGLDLQLPDPDTFSFNDVQNICGAKRMVQVVDVYRQQTVRMSLDRFLNVMAQPASERRRLYNILSLEVSDSKLAELISLPAVLRELSWVHQFWPDAHLPKSNAQLQSAAADDGSLGNNALVSHEHVSVKPEVSMFCLLSMAGSWTDWHVDFGGSSVWYHIIKGEKIFYVIAPSEAAFEAHEKLYVENKGRTKILCENLPAGVVAYRVHLHAGNTLMIPSGWIHMVYTPVDSLVFGGNFLHYMNVQLQFRSEELETGMHMDESFRFPRFELCNWYAAQRLVELWQEYCDEGEKMPKYLVEATEQLVKGLEHRRSRAYGKEKQLLSHIKRGELLRKLRSCLLRGTPVGKKSKPRRPAVRIKLPNKKRLKQLAVPASAPPAAATTGSLKVKIPRLGSVSDDVLGAAEPAVSSAPSATSAECATTSVAVQPSPVVSPAKWEAADDDKDTMIGFSLETSAASNTTAVVQRRPPPPVPRVNVVKLAVSTTPIAVRIQEQQSQALAEEHTVVASLSSDTVSSRGRVRKQASWLREAADLDADLDQLDNVIPSSPKTPRLILKTLPPQLPEKVSPSPAVDSGPDDVYKFEEEPESDHEPEPEPAAAVVAAAAAVPPAVLGVPKPIAPGTTAAFALKTKGALKQMSAVKSSPARGPSTPKQRLGQKLGLFKRR